MSKLMKIALTSGRTAYRSMHLLNTHKKLDTKFSLKTLESMWVKKITQEEKVEKLCRSETRKNILNQDNCVELNDNW